MAQGDPMAQDDDDDAIEAEVLSPDEAQALWLAVPEKQCTATNRQGQRCRRPGIPGGNVCIYHGGSAPQVKAKAAERLAYVRDIALESLTEKIVSDGDLMDPRVLLDATLKLTDTVERLEGREAAQGQSEESSDRSAEQLREDLYARFDQLDERRKQRELAAVEEMERQRREREEAAVAAKVVKVEREAQADESTTRLGG